MKDKIVDFWNKLPAVGKYGIAGFVAVFALALVAGLMSKPPAPASVAPVAPVGSATPATPSPAPVSVAPASAAPQAVSSVVAPPPAAVAATPGAVAPPGAAAVMRTAKQMTAEQAAALKQCAIQTVAIKSNRNDPAFTELGSVESCSLGAGMSLVPSQMSATIPGGIMSSVNASATYQLQRRGYVYAKATEAHTISVNAAGKHPRYRCEVYVDDLSAPLVVAEPAHGLMSQSFNATGTAQIVLEAGYHEFLTRCAVDRNDYHAAPVVDVLMRAESDSLPRTIDLYSLPSK